MQGLPEPDLCVWRGVAWGREPAGTLEGNPTGQGISKLPTL